MYSLMLSNWTTLRTPAAVTTIKQPVSQLLDLGEFEDVIGWLEVKEFSGATFTWSYQFSPTKDDAYFTGTTASTFTVAATGVTVTKLVLGASANLVYNARYLRYQLSTSVATASDITFRCWVSANIGARAKHKKPRCVCGRTLDLTLGRCGCGRLLRSAS